MIIIENNDCIRFLLGKSVDFHNRFNGAIEEIIRYGDGEKTVEKLLDSIRYLVDDMERIIKR